MTNQKPGEWKIGDRVRVHGLAANYDVTIIDIAAGGFFARHDTDDGLFCQGEARPFRWGDVIGLATGEPRQPHSATAARRS